MVIYVNAHCDRDHMRLLFERPLQTNDTIHQPTAESETLSPALAHDEQQLQTRKPVLSNLSTGPRNVSRSVASNSDGLREPGTQTRARPVRNTRATLRTSTQALSDDEKEVVKYSKTGKLGKPWLK